MKFTLLSLGILLSSILSLNAQTTQEEFNYITKGYPQILENGYDEKDGYTFDDIEQFSVTENNVTRKVSYQFLRRDGVETPCGMLLVFQRTDTKYKAFLCVPHHHSDQEIWTQAKSKFNDATNDWTKASRAYTWGLIEMISSMNMTKLI